MRSTPYRVASWAHANGPTVLLSASMAAVIVGPIVAIIASHLLGSRVETIRFVSSGASISVCGAASLALAVIYRAGQPLAPRSGTRADRDDAWMLLSVALLLWSAVGLVSLPKALVSAAPEWVSANASPLLLSEFQPIPPPKLSAVYLGQLTGDESTSGSDSYLPDGAAPRPDKTIPLSDVFELADGQIVREARSARPSLSVELATVASTTFLSILNNLCFLAALRRFDRPRTQRSWVANLLQDSTIWRWLRSVLVLFLALTPILVVMFRDAAVPIIQWSALLTSLVVMLSYTVELRGALIERGVRYLLVPWYVGLFLQVCIEFDTVVSAHSALAGVIGDNLWIRPALGATGQALICLALLGQALSWFLDAARHAAYDLATVGAELRRIRRDEMPGGDRAASLDALVWLIDGRLPAPGDGSLDRDEWGSGRGGHDE